MWYCFVRTLKKIRVKPFIIQVSIQLKVTKRRFVLERIPVNNIAGVGIIFRRENPGQVFIEVKDDGLPIKAFRRGLCPIGGNWIGEIAKGDKDSWDTFGREFNEEISAERARVSTLELRLLGFLPEGDFYQTPRPDYAPSPEEVKDLAEIKAFITSIRRPFGDFLINMPREVFDRADSGNKHEGFKALVSYWLVSLPERYWQQLVALQDAFHNLSNESITLITSLEEIVESKAKFAYGHEGPFREFFIGQGLKLARKIPLTEGIAYHEVGRPLASYADYSRKYDVKRNPFMNK